ncbi:hypothetical protein F4776DRAFT_423782 [Hypoxylon sp. NC0597]|nr:hypothetical protein F4776DRAFT_423782 [Hypoxylon sp. NC0597]
MADARALLRAHRAENRIKHPHAAYSDAGKLICKICHEIVRTEALWEAHINGPNHQRRFQVLQAQPGSGYYVEESINIGSGNGDNKRKYDDLSDTDDDFGEYDMPRKRGRLDTSGPTTAGSGNKRESPPTLNRRASNTPLHGVEIAIPSRPATPAAGSNSATSTPKGVPVGRSPLIGSETASTTTTTQQNAPISTQAVAAPSTTTTTATATATQAASDAVDAAEWAAFEAEIALASEPASTTATAPTSALAAISSSATISAPALSAAQLAAKSEEEEHERRKHLLDAQIADEREDAKLAFAAEMEEMEELEGRVRRLKERREELRKGSVANLRGAAAAATATATSTTAAGANAGADVVMAKGPTADGKENNGGTIHEEDEEDEEDDEEDDGWSAFRFR